MLFLCFGASALSHAQLSLDCPPLAGPQPSAHTPPPPLPASWHPALGSQPRTLTPSRVSQRLSLPSRAWALHLAFQPSRSSPLVTPSPPWGFSRSCPPGPPTCCPVLAPPTGGPARKVTPMTPRDPTFPLHTCALSPNLRATSTAGVSSCFSNGMARGRDCFHCISLFIFRALMQGLLWATGCAAVGRQAQ